MINEQKILEADERARRWLAEANRLEESGKGKSKAFETANRKCQYWLDRLNQLQGKGAGQ